MTPVLECRSLTSGYGDVSAIRSVDLHVDAGEVVCLLGSNGAGKTTTLLTLSGVLRPISGEVRLLGSPVAGGRPHVSARRGCALVPDDRSLFYSLTARENLRVQLGRRQAKQGIAEVLNRFPALEPRLDIKAGALSGGEQQMLSIGRALCGHPQALMIDELSLGLAPVIAKSILPVLRNVAREEGTAVLLVEQHVDLALTVCDRGYILSHGELTLSGSAHELAAQREVLAATYMGEIRGQAGSSVDGGELPGE